MSATDPDAVSAVPRPATEVRPAAAIYGLIVTAAVIASAGGHLTTGTLVLAVVVTLVVYWLAEEYAELISSSQTPGWSQIRSALRRKWPMVSASYTPLAALLCARLVGATATTAAFVALGVTLATLTYYGWSAAREAGMHGLALVVMTCAASSLGLLMIALKIVITHLH